MGGRRRLHRPKQRQLDIPTKANRVLNVIFVMLLLIVVRVWHLTVVQYEEKEEEARKPQRKVLIETANRGTIRDRFNIPLAINKVQYNAAILYSQITHIPTIRWRTIEGQRKKTYPRREYIEALAKFLGKELDLDADRIEDLIYSKASFFAHVPYVLKEDITEKQYYRLKAKEKDWLGLQGQRVPKRTYPRGKTASDILGYMGAIDKQKYTSIANEIKTLQNYFAEREKGEEVSLPEGLDSPSQASKRLLDLQEKVYTINDYVGKAGVEGKFEEDLRGFHGKKSYCSDAKGNFLRELPGSREPLSGQRYILTISAELQEYAEKLLTQNERIRKGLVSGVTGAKREQLSRKQPWIKGGAILAMDPKSGDILALASYPRTDPNDFVPTGDLEGTKQKRANIRRWFETEGYIADIWDQKRPLERERYDDLTQMFYEEKKIVDWSFWIDTILSPDSPLKVAMKSFNTVKQAVELQNHVQELQKICGQSDAYAIFNQIYQGADHKPFGGNLPAIEKIALEECLEEHKTEISLLKYKLDPYMASIPNNYDKVLLVDISQVAVSTQSFHGSVLAIAGEQTLSEYRDACAAGAIVSEMMRSTAKDLFHVHVFKKWREEYGKAWLAEKREEEKAKKQYQKPYLDYFDALESRMFQEFWMEHRWKLTLALLGGRAEPDSDPLLEPFFAHFLALYQECSNGAHMKAEWASSYLILKKTIQNLETKVALAYLQTLRGYHELDRPLFGRYRRLRSRNTTQLEKHLAAGFYPLYGHGYGRSQAYRQSATLGSLFKIVTAYTGLVQRYHELPPRDRIPSKMSPLTIQDRIFRKGKELCVACLEDGTPVPRFYKGGRLLKSTHSIGTVDLMRAIETSSNSYFSLLAGDYLNHPNDLAASAKLFSYGSRTGIDLPWEIAGSIPKDLEENKTGLYATAIGQHTLVVTPLQSSVMLSSIANGGRILKPKIVRMKMGRTPRRGTEVYTCSPEFPYKEQLRLVGIDFPLFSGAQHKSPFSLITRNPTSIRQEIFLPKVIRDYLLESLVKVVHNTQNKTLWSLSRFYQDYPEAISDYVDLREELVGKTSTAEQVEITDLDPERGANMYTHVWFGGISFQLPESGKQRFAFASQDRFGHPELVVVVYLRYGAYGKEAAPLAAQMVRKWREIKGRFKGARAEIAR